MEWHFDLRPLIWLHYVLLAIGFIFILVPLNTYLFDTTLQTNVLVSIIYYTIGAGILDQIIHNVLGVD